MTLGPHPLNTLEGWRAHVNYTANDITSALKEQKCPLPGIPGCLLTCCRISYFHYLCIPSQVSANHNY